MTPFHFVYALLSRRKTYFPVTESFALSFSLSSSREGRYRNNPGGKPRFFKDSSHIRIQFTIQTAKRMCREKTSFYLRRDNIPVFVRAYEIEKQRQYTLEELWIQ